MNDEHVVEWCWALWSLVTGVSIGEPQGLTLLRGELVLAQFDDLGLIELVDPMKGHRIGASGKVAPGLWVRASAPVSQPVQTLVDTGTVYVTSKRVVFTGAAKTRTWKTNTLLGVRPEPLVAGAGRRAKVVAGSKWLVLQVPNSSKREGFCIDEPWDAIVERAIASGVAAAAGNLGAELRRAEIEVRRRKLTLPEEIADLFVGSAAPAAAQPATSESPTRSPVDADAHDVVALIERLGDLRAAGVLSEQEFETKKADLLARI